MNKSILVLGKPESGKSIFKNQLFLKIETPGNPIKFYKSIDNIEDLKEGNERLRDGLDIPRTAKGVNTVTTLPIQLPNGDRVDVEYPEAAGEQTNDIIKKRRVSKVWYNNISKSDSWILFIRVDQIKIVDDMLSKDYKNLSAANIEDHIEFEIVDDAYYIELLQILLYHKSISTLIPIKNLKLTILLSCWDKLEAIEQNTSPVKFLKTKLPLFANFIETLWDKEALNIIALSSLEQDLDQEKPDENFIDDGPEDKGYLVMSNSKEKIYDLTQIFNLAL